MSRMFRHPRGRFLSRPNPENRTIPSEHRSERGGDELRLRPYGAEVLFRARSTNPDIWTAPRVACPSPASPPTGRRPPLRVRRVPLGQTDSIALRAADTEDLA